MGFPFPFAVIALLSVTQPSGPDDLEWEDLPEPSEIEDGEVPQPADPVAPTAPPSEPAEDAAPVSTTDDEDLAAEQLTDPPDSEPPDSEPPDSEPPASEPDDPPPPLQPPAPRSGPGPNWRRGGDSYYGGTLVGPLLGAGPRAVAFGAGVTHFVVPYVGLGADLLNVVRWNGDGSGAYYEFQLTPTLTLLALPRRRFTPLVWGGFGLDVFSHKLGTYGRWVGGAGFAFTVGRLAIVTVGVQVDGREPLARWNYNFTCGITQANCSLSLSPVIGFSIPL